MARACVEDTCSIVAGNGVSNPNALKLDVQLDPAGGIVCTPGLGLGVNIPLGVGGCHNILKKDVGTGALSVEQPGVGNYSFPSISNLALAYSSSGTPANALVTSIVVVNPFVGCAAIMVATVSMQFNYTVDTVINPDNSQTGYYIRPISFISAAGPGATSAGFGNPAGLAGATSILQRQDAYGTTAAAGPNADIQEQYEMILPVVVAAGGSATFDVYHNQFQQGNTASGNIRHSAFPSTTGNPFVGAAGNVIAFKLGVVN